MFTAYFSASDLAAIIQVAYEIASCNDEGLTDADEAIRIWTERTGNCLPLPMDEIYAAIRNEFKQL